MKKCKICKVGFEKKMPMQFVCSPKCAIVYANQQKNKDWKSKKKEIKADLQTRPLLLKALQVSINELIRTIDYGQDCISSGKKITDQRQAGHFWSAGSHPAIRFNLLNIYVQSARDNMYFSGNLLEYRKKLYELFGPETAEEIENLPKQYKVLKMTRDNIKDAIKKCKMIIKRHKLEYTDVTHNQQDRIKFRTMYNNELGIYK